MTKQAAPLGAACFRFNRGDFGIGLWVDAVSYLKDWEE
jgi:hypothetical protein